MKGSQLRPMFIPSRLQLLCLCASVKALWWCRRHSALREEVQESAHLNQDSRQISQSLWTTNTDHWDYHESVIPEWEETNPSGQTEERRLGDLVTQETRGWSTPKEPRRSGWKWRWVSRTLCVCQ